MKHDQSESISQGASVLACARPHELDIVTEDQSTDGVLAKIDRIFVLWFEFTYRIIIIMTEVGNALATSQSGVSKHILDLEDELGIELFVRKGKRLLGLTEPGKELLTIVARILLDTKNIKQLGAQFSQADKGQLTTATTHTQARYALPNVVSQFKKKFPGVHLALH